MLRKLTLLSVFSLFVPAAAGAQPGVRCYLVDSRVHVAVVSRADAGGELCWHDTVSGRAGEAPFVQRGDRLLLGAPGRADAEAHLLPDLAIVVRNPPWGSGSGQLSLGVALD